MNLRAWVQRLIGDQPEYVALQRDVGRMKGDQSATRKRLNVANMNLVAMRGQLARNNVEWQARLDGSHTELRVLLAKAEAERDLARAAIGWILEDQSADNTCTKIRFETTEGAQKLADRLHERDGAEMCVYSCEVCPRHPFTCERYRHVARTETRAMRRERGCVPRPPRPFDPTKGIAGRIGLESA